MAGKSINIYDEIGIPSVKHNKAICKLTEPLKIHFGIDRFWRNSHCMDGSYSLLGNFPPAAELFFGHQLFQGHPYFRNPIFFQSGFTLPELLQNEEFEKTQGRLTQKGDCFHVFIKIQKHEHGFVEYGFATSKPYLGFEMTYLNHLKAINKFVDYFEKGAEKLIKNSEEYRVNLPQIIGSQYDENPKIMGNIIVPGKELAFHMAMEKDSEKGKALLSLSKSERACLKPYVLGNTAKEIAKKFYRSTRTIESHLENAKEKLGVRTRSELIDTLLPLIDLL